MSSKRHIIRLICLPAALTVVWLGCTSTTVCREEPAGPPEAVMTGRDGKPFRVRVEVVTRPEEQARGLMHRQHLDADSGMLFVYTAEDRRYFWMKNTYIPLDMVFIGANRRIVGIVRNAEPLTAVRREVDAPSQYVLEVNAGFTQRHGIRAGSPVRLENIPGIEP